MQVLKELFSLFFVISFFGFCYLWWKKRRARLGAGEDYRSDAQYLHFSKIKRIVGVVCIVSLLLVSALPGENREQRIDKDIAAMVKKLDETTPEKMKTDGHKVSQFGVLGEVCEYCGKESEFYNEVNRESGKKDKGFNLISGDSMSDLAHSKCPKSPDGHHSLKTWYQRIYQYSSNEKKWVELHSSKLPRIDTETYKRYLLNKSEQ
jgi:hypothetical protein